jgi:hypothetical protein
MSWPRWTAMVFSDRTYRGYGSVGNYRSCVGPVIGGGLWEGFPNGRQMTVDMCKFRVLEWFRQFLLGCLA